jgi:hypothetical protein
VAEQTVTAREAAVALKTVLKEFAGVTRVEAAGDRLVVTVADARARFSVRARFRHAQYHYAGFPMDVVIR